MIRPSPTTASRSIVVALLCFLVFAGATAAREFTAQQLSEPKSNARTPTISETGLIAWQGYSPHEGNSSLSTRPDVLFSPPDTSRSDIFVWQNGRVDNVTKDQPDIVGRSQQPIASGDAVVFLAWYKESAAGGYPFVLGTPQKTDEMQQMEADYPALFDPPLSAPASALEAADTNRPPAEPDPAPAATTQEVFATYQNWRGSGKAGDVAVYRPGQGIERITPGTRHFCAPAMSGAGIAFQCARGWPYGYEMLVWRPGATNLVQITTNYYYALNPNVHGNELVFQGWDGNDYEIYLYRFDADQLEQITNNQFDDVSPVVWDGRVAWIAHPTITAEIFYLADGTIRKISEGTQDNGAPSIWQDKVVWQGYDDTDLEIYYFNGRRAIKLTSNTWDDMSPQIRDGLITWMSYVDNWDSEIMAFDLSDNIAVQLTNNEFEDSFPQTAGEKIVWQAIGGDGTSIQLAEPKEPRAAPVN